jgi:hypothetical protein
VTLLLPSYDSGGSMMLLSSEKPLETVAEVQHEAFKNDAGGETRMNTIRLVIVDDHPMVREGLKLLISDEDGFEIIGEALMSSSWT